MQNKFKLIILVAILTLFIVQMFPVRAQESFPHTTINPAYVPVHVVISFAFSTNITQPVISSLNQSAWSFNITSNPPSNSLIEFSTVDVDVFQFGFTVYYPFSINQTVTIEVFQGSMQIEGIYPYPVSGDSFGMTFTVVTSNEPHYPSPQDIFNMWSGQYPTRSDFLAWQQLMANENEVVNSNLVWQWIVVGVISVVFFFGELIRVVHRKPRGET
jgi:hypothetical protein